MAWDPATAPTTRDPLLGRRLAAAPTTAGLGLIHRIGAQTMTKIDIRPVKLSDDNRETANHALTRFRAYLAEHQNASQIHVDVQDGGDREPLALPREVVELLVSLLAHLGAGRSVSIVPSDAELTTQQAADILQVSRPYLIGLLDAGEIEYRTVGTHRRITASSLLEYQRRDDHRRRLVADELTRLGPEMGTI